MAGEGGFDIAALWDNSEALGAGVLDEGFDEFGGDAPASELGWDQSMFGDADGFAVFFVRDPC